MQRRARFTPALLACAAVIAGCAAAPAPPVSRGAVPPAVHADTAPAPVLFPGMGSHRRPVTTDSPEAQRWFDQGLVWAFAFNHDEAIRSFQEAARIDPACAMAWWGVALCHGPHINNPAMDAARSEAAWAAVQRAQALVSGATPIEAALIEALGARYGWPPPADRSPLDMAYAQAMLAVQQRFPDDADVATLAAEAMMDLRPWDLWTPDGSPQPGTLETVALLERAMRLAPDHPGANHLFIHAMEASPEPQRAAGAADRLRALVPGSGHLLHMPGHIDVRLGRWNDAILCNQRAIAADAAYRARSPRQGFYHVYMAHNHHFLAFAAMMDGQEEEALAAARAMVAGVPSEFLERSAALADPSMSIVYDVQKRFGRWDALLAEPAPDPRLPIATAMWRFSRGVAWAAKGDVGEARREQARFRDALSNVPADALMAINPARRVLEIADAMLAGEIAFAEGDIDGAVRELRAAVGIEDTLRYMEPPDWIQPVRHALGAVLLSAGRHGEAVEVYREDLRRWPENGWSLLGLQRSLAALGESDEAAEVAKRLSVAWARSEVAPTTSCLCVRGAETAARGAATLAP